MPVGSKGRPEQPGAAPKGKEEGTTVGLRKGVGDEFV